ncbi:hypothetical protein L1277_002554 [Okibacterium sp. HSC-33S16]|nr:hypothetical protein [Okibacterium sp. HSC-33S16]
MGVEAVEFVMVSFLGGAVVVDSILGGLSKFLYHVRLLERPIAHKG